MKKTPYKAKIYLLLAVFFLALPTLGSHYYKGQTGRFIIASDHLRHEPFRESVIYIVRHNLNGAYGIVINKPLDLQKLKEKLSIDAGDISSLNHGGPVGFPLETAALVANNPDEILGDFTVHQKFPLPKLAEQIERYPFKQIYLGYSGWGPLQLEIEILRGTWATIDAPKDIIFDQQEQKLLWQKLYQESSGDMIPEERI